MKQRPRTLEQIRIAGLRALRRELGPVGMVQFLHQYETGAGDYTEDRRTWRDHWTLDEIIAELEEHRQRKSAT